MKRCNTVQEYISTSAYFQEELIRLREILQSTKLVETVKWGSPCYTHDNKLVVGLGAYTSYVGLWFYQGALLSDPDGVLTNAQEGKTRAMRQWRFTSAREIRVRPIKAYIKEAIGHQESGQEIKPDRSKPLDIPTELVQALATNKTARAAFDALTKGKQREFSSHIADAKREETRLKRLEKIIPMIEAGKGLHDNYR